MNLNQSTITYISCLFSKRRIVRSRYKPNCDFETATPDHVILTSLGENKFRIEFRCFATPRNTEYKIYIERERERQRETERDRERES